MSPKIEGHTNRALQLDYRDKAIQRANELVGEHGRNECQKYRLYHLLIGSNIDEGQFFEKFDLPNGEIQNFIENLSPSASKASKAAA